MEKSVGFRRDIRAAWFDAAATYRAESPDLSVLRARLDQALTPEIPGPANRQLTVGILVRLWGRSEAMAPDLHAEAITRFAASEDSSDRVWLHHGLSLIGFPFFRNAVTAIGLMDRRGQEVTRGAVKGQMIAERGQLGSLENATAAVLFALRQWGMLVPASHRYTYQAAPPRSSRDPDLGAWLLACALEAHPERALPFPDLLALPCLFPFRMNLTVDDLRRDTRFDVERQGSGWDLVRRPKRAPAAVPSAPATLSLPLLHS